MRRAFWSAAAVVVLSAAPFLVFGCTGASGSSDAGTSAGRTIFATGQGHAGLVARSMMGGPFQTKGLACAVCHGAQGQGTGIGPSITRATLGSRHTVTHKPSTSNLQPQPVTEGPWTPDQTVKVAQTGTTPEGNALGGRMPRWRLDSQDASALAAYLGSLR
jgi:mono/diheme cytochrome c family protein